MIDDQVPDFELDDDYSIPVSSTRVTGKSAMPEDDIMELVWHDGQLVTQRQSQLRHNSGQTQKWPAKYDVVSTMTEHVTAPAAPSETQLFMHEDEMVSWLHYPLNDDEALCSDLLYTAAKTPPPPRPPVHPVPARKPEAAPAQNFLMFSRLNSNNNTMSSSRFETAAPTKSVVRETATVVDSSDTPLVGPISGAVEFRRDNNNNDSSSPGISVSGDVGGGGRGGGGIATPTLATAGSAGKEGTCEMSLTSPPGGGSTSGSGSLNAELASTQKPPPVDKKRKGREVDDAAEFQSQDVEFESGSAKKQKQGSSSTRRSRAAEVHNLSERRRRDRINEKMRVLQEMIPRCNKLDKASILEEAIEYMKSLKMQLQMVSMGCGMVPMMFPGVPPYMPMGMARMGMDMSRHMMPYGNVLPGSPMPPPAAAAQMGPRFPMPAYQMQTMHPEDPNRVQTINQSENMSHMPRAEIQNQPQGPSFADPYQQYFTPQQMQMRMQMLQQHQAMAQQSSKPSSSRAPENQDIPQ